MNIVYISVYVFFDFFHQHLTVFGVQFLEYRSFVSLGTFAPRYFILSDVIVNGIAS